MIDSTVLGLHAWTRVVALHAQLLAWCSAAEQVESTCLLSSTVWVDMWLVTSHAWSVTRLWAETITILLSVARGIKTARSEHAW